MKLLDDILKKIPTLSHTDRSTISFKALDGWSNHNYQFEFDNQEWVIREPVAREEEGINRRAELYNTTQAAQAGLCLPYTYFDEKTGICLRPFIGGKPPVDDENKLLDSSLISIAKVLKTLHSMPNQFLNNVDNFTLLNQTMAHIHRYSESSLNEFEDLFEDAKHIQYCLSQYPKPLVPCHNDPNPRNFLLTSDLNICLLDWEYSGNGDAAWDIAYFIAHGDLTKAQEKSFLDAYFSNKIPMDQYSRVILYKPMTLFIFLLWIRLRRLKGHMPVRMEELIYWEETLRQEIEDYCVSEPHQQALFELSR